MSSRRIIVMLETSEDFECVKTFKDESKANDYADELVKEVIARNGLEPDTEMGDLHEATGRRECVTIVYGTAGD